MKNKKNFILFAKLFSIVIILATFIFFFVYSVFLPRTTYSNYDKLTEKPELTFAGLLDGSYTEQIGDYFADTIHSRDGFKDLYAKMRNLFGIKTVSSNGSEVVQRYEESEDPDYDPFADISIDLPGESSSEISSNDPSEEPNISENPESSLEESEISTPVESSEEQSQNEQPKKGDKAEICGSVLVMDIDSHTWALEIYGGDANLKTIPTFASTLNSFAEKNPSVNVCSMVIPKAAAYYLKYSEDYASRAGNTLRDLNAIESHLSDKVKSINIYQTLENHSNEQIYFRTDHHWTALGAYYSAQKLANDLGLPFAGLSEYDANIRQGYIGTMYNYSDKSTRILNDPEEFAIYRPKITYSASYYDQKFNYIRDHDILWSVSDEKRSSWYMSFLNGDSYSWKVHSDGCTNGRKLLVVKDSYGNCLIPSLLYSFEYVYVVDAREFEMNLNTLVQSEGITDVLFTECAFSAVSAGYIKDLIKLCA